AVFCVTSPAAASASRAKSIEASFRSVGPDNRNGKVGQLLAARRHRARPPRGGGVLLCGELLQSFDFERGMPPLNTAWSAFKATVPARIGTDPNGNKFIRITATRA